MTQQFARELDSLSAKNGWMDCWLVVDGQRHHTVSSPEVEQVIIDALLYISQAE